MSTPSSHPPALHEALRYARAMKVHRRQSLLLCSLIQNAASPDLTGEDAAKWLEALNTLYERLFEWSQLSTVDAYFASDDILQGILYLYQNEFRWCNLLSEPHYNYWSSADATTSTSSRPSDQSPPPKISCRVSPFNRLTLLAISSRQFRRLSNVKHTRRTLWKGSKPH
ncbi:hypothetical protein SCHPADRAFT_116026 [Schizopora paradoxa]|uniref:Uncharacterized protein n=1 Tax=Schizopora paradoxa TaxID=27342 RepID=A0A0H2SA65_9AGAM|nr:hypothetical protein SCHPADRAFT_116026 [Schizopora paradoxa]